MNNWLEFFIDRRGGVVICFVLTLFERIRRLLWPVRRDLPPVKRILFVKPVEQGAIVLAYGAVKHAVDLVGRENVFFFAFEKNREILDILDVVPRENIITARDDTFLTFAVSMLAALRRMRGLCIDTAVDLEIFARISIIIAYLSGAQRRVGLHRFNSEGPYRGSLVSHCVQYNPYLHTAQAFDVFARAAFAAPDEAPLLKETPTTPPCPPPRFTPTQADHAALDDMLREAAPELLDGDGRAYPIVLFNPKCLDELPARKWPDPSFVALGKKILGLWPESRILITGLPSEQAACAAMQRAMSSDRVFNLAGKLTLRTLITLMTRSDALISTDSGPAHFAALTDIAGVVLFGPETPLLYSPLSARLRVLYLGLACSPCFSPMNYRLSPCTNNRCLREITDDMIITMLRDALDHNQRASAAGDASESGS